MSLRDSIPLRRCATRGCPFLGPWPEHGLCPEHQQDIPRRAPSLMESWTADERNPR